VRAVLAFALVLAAAAPAGAGAAGKPGRAGAPSDPLEARRAAIADELIRLGATIRGEIERGDADAIVARVPVEGLRCGGQLVPRERVARDLRNPSSWLHGVVFAAPRADGRAASLRALFRSANEIAVVVGFHGGDPRAGPEGRPCLSFRAKGRETPGAPLCFESRGGRWWLTESLYPC
jgi:hypothetical protein